MVSETIDRIIGHSPFIYNLYQPTKSNNIESENVFLKKSQISYSLDTTLKKS